jgi:hypothetical protein
VSIRVPPNDAQRVAGRRNGVLEVDERVAADVGDAGREAGGIAGIAGQRCGRRAASAPLAVLSGSGIEKIDLCGGKSALEC